MTAVVGACLGQLSQSQVLTDKSHPEKSVRRFPLHRAICNNLSFVTIQWVHGLDLNDRDRRVVEGSVSRGLLSDKHMYAAQELIRKQFAQIGGLQSTLLCQSYGFACISCDGMQPHSIWLAITNSNKRHIMRFV